METYTFLRELADSWVLLAMTLFFLGMVLWTLRPGSKAVHEDVSRIPLRNEDEPLPAQTSDCAGGCAECGGCRNKNFEV